jgi:hypothetical protein
VANERGRVFERMADGATARPREQHQPAVGCRRCLWSGGAGLAVGGGARDRADQPEEAALELSARQVELMANADLRGLAITLK